MNYCKSQKSLYKPKDKTSYLPEIGLRNIVQQKNPLQSKGVLQSSIDVKCLSPKQKLHIYPQLQKPAGDIEAASSFCHALSSDTDDISEEDCDISEEYCSIAEEDSVKISEHDNVSDDEYNFTDDENFFTTPYCSQAKLEVVYNQNQRYKAGFGRGIRLKTISEEGSSQSKVDISTLSIEDDGCASNRHETDIPPKISCLPQQKQIFPNLITMLNTRTKDVTI
jgi:hypothetical protein